MFSLTWAESLAFWALPAALATLLWLPWVVHRAAADGQAPPQKVRGLWRDSLAWQVTLFMGLQSALAYIIFGWLAPILRARGLTAMDAGFALSLSVIAQAAASLVAPLLATIGRDQRAANVIAVVVTLVGLLGCVYAPLSTIWLWSLLLGIGQGATIAIALTLIALRASDPNVATQLSGMVQGIGYLIASAGPLLAGLLHSWTGGWNAVAAFSLLIGLGLAVSGFAAGRPGYVRPTG
jgi:CP family cyanate transporter-like MFS transporter